jgi:hypothetical protein
MSSKQDNTPLEPSAAERVQSIVARMRAAEAELADELEKTRAEVFQAFDEKWTDSRAELFKRQKELRVSLWNYVRGASLGVIVTAPFIYAVIFPALLLDLFVTVFQALCFPAYGIPKVRRADYIVFDRQNLAYLNILEKINCGYCSYVNGLFAYVREIGARTEQYWCPIKHVRKLIAPHTRYADFVEYGDAEAYHDQLEALRQQLAGMGSGTSKVKR